MGDVLLDLQEAEEAEEAEEAHEAKHAQQPEDETMLAAPTAVAEGLDGSVDQLDRY